MDVGGSKARGDEEVGRDGRKGGVAVGGGYARRRRETEGECSSCLTLATVAVCDVLEVRLSVRSSGTAAHVLHSDCICWRRVLPMLECIKKVNWDGRVVEEVEYRLEEGTTGIEAGKCNNDEASVWGEERTSVGCA